MKTLSVGAKEKKKIKTGMKREISFLINSNFSENFRIINIVVNTKKIFDNFIVR